MISDRSSDKSRGLAARSPDDSRANASHLGLVTSADDHPDGDAELVSADQMAHALGVSRATVDRARKAGRLPAVRRGQGWAFRRTEIVEMGELRQRVPTSAVERERREGEVASQCFAMFDECVPVERVVRDVKAPPALVLRLFDDWNRCRAATARWLRPAPPLAAPQPPPRQELDWHQVTETA